MIFIIVVVLLLISLVGGGLGHSRYGYAGCSPAGIIVVLLGILYFTGHLRC